MTETDYDEKHLRLRCLELARPLFPTTADMDALLRAADKLWEFINAPYATGNSGSGSPSGSSAAQPAQPFKLTEEQRRRLDPAEIDRMLES